MPLLRCEIRASRFRGQGLSPRRTFLKLAGAGAVVGAAYGGAGLLRRVSAPSLTYEPLPGVAGFRRVAGGAVSSGATPFVGLGSAPTPAVELPDICTALFAPDRPADAVPIAYFSDPRCVNCRQVSPILAEMDAGPGVHVTWHEWPILGPMSERAARATLAAERQGARAAFHTRLMGAALLPTDSYLARLADEVGIDSTRLLADMSDPEIDRRFARTVALARTFGFAGTPALVIGRTAVLGRMDRAQLQRLVEAERADTGPFPCPVGR